MKNLNSLPIRARMVAIFLAFVVPMCVLGIELDQKIREDLTLTRAEIDGTIYMQPLIKLLSEAANYQSNLLLKNSGALVDDKLKNSQNTMQQQLQTLGKIDAQYAATLELTPEGLEKHKQTGLLYTDLQDAYQTLITSKANNIYAIDTFIQKIADISAFVYSTSNIILDPELDSSLWATLLPHASFPF